MSMTAREAHLEDVATEQGTYTLTKEESDKQRASGDFLGEGSFRSPSENDPKIKTHSRNLTTGKREKRSPVQDCTPEQLDRLQYEARSYKQEKYAD